jgi:hypothetical protein
LVIGDWSLATCEFWITNSSSFVFLSLFYPSSFPIFPIPSFPMLKTLGFTTTFLVLIGSIATVSVADPLPTFTYPNTTLDDSQLFCYMQTADGRMLDLGRICGRPRPAASAQQTGELISAPVSAPLPMQSTPSSTASGGLNLPTTGDRPIPNAAGLRNDNTPTCFVFDAQGRPCASLVQ